MSSLSMFRHSTFAAFLAFTSFASACHAQDAGTAARVNVPFAFETESRHFAAGVYTLRTENDHILLIQGAGDSWLAMMRTEDNAQREKTGKAVFHKYGSHYFLSEITAAGRSRQIHLTPSRAESEMKKVQKGTAPSNVELALLQGSR